MNRAETTVTGTDITQDHEGGHPATEALVLVGTPRALADGVQATGLEQLIHRILRAVP
jgi:hypothetical protein